MDLKDFSLEGKIALITGATYGIGYAIAKAYAACGAKIVFCDRNQEAVDRGNESYKKDGIDAKGYVCDVTKEDEVKAVFAECEKIYGKLDFVVHAVAFANREDLQGEFINTSKEGWDLAMGVSAYSLVSICRNARPLMNEGGSVVALTYIGSEMYVANYNIMAIAKAALEASMRYLAVDMGKNGVRVNCLSAGPIKTLAASGISGFGNMLKAIALKSPLNRNTTLDDVGNAGLFLASPLSSGTTGEVLYCDCGCHKVHASIKEIEAMNNAE